MLTSYLFFALLSNKEKYKDLTALNIISIIKEKEKEIIKEIVL